MKTAISTLALLTVLTLSGEVTEAQANYSFKNLTAGEYQQMFDSFVAQGYRPVSITGKAVGGQARYNVVFAKNTVAFQARHGINSNQFQLMMRQMAEQGYRIDIHSAYTVNGQLLHAAVWIK